MKKLQSNESEQSTNACFKDILMRKSLFTKFLNYTIDAFHANLQTFQIKTF